MLNRNYRLSNEFSKLFLLSIGAIPGALIRWQINDDFTVNIFGSIIIGFLAGMQVRQKINLLFL